MKKIFGVFVVLFCIFCTAGCQKDYTYTMYRSALGDWVGKNAQDLEQYWGRPYTLEDKGVDTRIYTYYRTDKGMFSGRYDPYFGSHGAGVYDGEDHDFLPSYYYCRVTFTVRNNVVAKYDFDGDGCY